MNITPLKSIDMIKGNLITKQILTNDNLDIVYNSN